MIEFATRHQVCCSSYISSLSPLCRLLPTLFDVLPCFVMDSPSLNVARLNCLAFLQLPRRSKNDEHICFFDVLIPCCYNPAFSPIVCSMHYAPCRRQTILPGRYHIIATVCHYLIHSCPYILTLLFSDRTFPTQCSLPQSCAFPRQVYLHGRHHSSISFSFPYPLLL